MGDLAEKTDKPPSLFILVSAGGLLFGAWFVVLYPWIRYQFWQSDTFWLIEAGRLILEKHCLPTHDPYSFTASAPHWMLYQWLTEVIFGLAHFADGLTGVALLGAALMATLFFILMFRQMLTDGTNSLIGVAAITLATYAYYPDFSSLRPQLLSFVLFWLLAMVCADSRSGLPIWKALTLTFIIAVVWANCHLSFPIGVVLLAANIAGSLLLSMRKTGNKRDLLLLAAMLVTFLTATMVTPFGFSLWSFVFNAHNLYFSQEVQPLTWPDKPILCTLGLSLLASCLYLRRKLDVRDFLSLAALLYIGSTCTRLIVYFCILSCPVLGRAMTLLLDAWLNHGPLGKLSQAIRSVALSRFYPFAILVLSTFVVISQPTLIPRNIPVQAAKFLALHPIPGNLFCSAHAGSYLIYSAHGAIPVFVDTRLDLYDTDFVRRVVGALDTGEGWRILFYQYKIAAALVFNGEKLRFVLDRQPDWKLLYRDREFSIYIPSVTQQ